MFVDTHAHLFYPNFKNETDDVIQRALNAGVKYILVPATDIASAVTVIEMTEKYDCIYGAVGIHPHDTKEWNDSFLKDIEELAKHPKIVAIGEIGLDYFYDFSPKEKQIDAFKAQIELALSLNKPIIVHNREADKDILSIAKEYANTGLRAQYHCFNASLEHARELIQMHHFISFTGNITFKKADTLRNTAGKIHLNNLLLETDSPFMTPVPYRGKRNEPSHIPIIAETLAEVHHVSVEDIARATSYNAFKLFGIGNKPGVSYTYQIGSGLYLNLTNRCSADCIFCNRSTDAVVKGYNLKMSHSEEPPVDVYIKEIGDPKKYSEIVFCGYGEPTIRWNEVKEIAKYVKEQGGKTRLNTNGHGNVINKKDITLEFKGLIDSVSISLNSHDPNEYARLMKVKPEMHSEMIDFAKKAKDTIGNVTMTIVGMSDIDEEKAKQFVEEKIGVSFRTREYF